MDDNIFYFNCSFYCELQNSELRSIFAKNVTDTFCLLQRLFLLVETHIYNSYEVLTDIGEKSTFTESSFFSILDSTIATPPKKERPKKEYK